MKKNKETYNDYINKENQKLLLSIGFKETFPITCTTAGIWIEENFPESILRKGYCQWREDFLEKAFILYPYQNLEYAVDFNAIPKNDEEMHYKRRNYIIKLAMLEILNKSEGISIKSKNNNIGSTIMELKFDVPNEKFDEFATHLSAIKKLLEK